MYLLGNYEIIYNYTMHLQEGKKRKRLDNKRTSNTRHDLQKREEKMKEKKKERARQQNT